MAIYPRILNVNPYSWTIINAGTGDITNATVLGASYAAYVTGIVNTSQKNINYKIGDGSTAWSSLPYKLPVYIEISADTDLSSYNLGVNGNKLKIRNTDTSAHTVTFASGVSEPIAPGELFTGDYTTAWILDHYTTSISASDTYSPAHRKNILICDTSSGSVVVTLDDSSFIQDVEIKCDGTGLVEVNHANLYTNGVFISDGKSLKLSSYYDSALHWDVVSNGALAEYTNVSSVKVLMYPSGRLVQSKKVSCTYSSVSALSGLFTFDRSFVSTPEGAKTGIDLDDASVSGSTSTLTEQYRNMGTGSITLNIRDSSGSLAGGDTGTVFCEIEGEYA